MEKDKYNKIISKIDDETLDRIIYIIEKLSQLGKTLETIEELGKTGALDTLAEFIYMIHSSKEMISDDMVSGAASIAGNFIDIGSKITMPPMNKLILAVLDHQMELEEEYNKIKINGLWSLMKILRDKEVQRGLSIVFALLKILGKYAGASENG